MRRSDLVMASMAVAVLALLAAPVFFPAQRYRRDQQWTLHSYQMRERILT